MHVKKTKYAKFLILISESEDVDIQSGKMQFEKKKKTSSNTLSILYHFIFSCTLDSILRNNIWVVKNLFKVQQFFYSLLFVDDKLKKIKGIK